MKMLTMKLPDRLASWVERESRRKGRSKSAFVREILENQQSGTATSTLNAIGDLCGCVDSGLGDLSHNRKRLRGFGT
jgi:hypothetical protein